MSPGLVTAQDVLAAARTTLQAHLPTVLAAVSDPPLPMPKTHMAPSMDALRRDAVELPVMVVTSDGTGTFRRDQQGVYSAEWALDVGFLIRSAEGTFEATDRDVHLYAAAIRTVWIEQPTLGGFAKDLRDIEETYAQAAPVAARTLGEGLVSCTVEVFDVARRGTRFTDPQPVPVAQTTTVLISPAQGDLP